MAHLMPVPKFKATDSNGDPLAGGKLYSYAAGTSTPLATYTDQGEGTANANPVVLDANGEATVWLGTSSYKLVLKNSSDVTQWTVDNVQHIGPSEITTAKLADGNVTTIKIADLAVTTGKIEDLAVTTGKIANDAVTTAKIDDEAVTVPKLDPAVFDIDNFPDTLEIVFKKSGDYSDGHGIKGYPQYPWSAPTLANPGFMDTTNITAMAWSSNGEFLATTNQTTPYIKVHHRTLTNFVALASPVSLPAGDASGVAWSPNSDFLAVAHDTTPYVTIYSRSGPTLTKLSNPGTLPTGNGQGVAWSPNGQFLAVAHTTTPFVTIYQRTGSTFTKLTNPSDLPAGNGVGVGFSPDGRFLAVSHATSPFLTIYDRSGTTFTKLSDPSDLPAAAGGIIWSPNSEFLWSSDVLYQRSSTTFTEVSLPDASAIPLAWSPNSAMLAVGVGSSPFVKIYTRVNTTFTALANPADLISNDPTVGAWSPDCQFLAVAEDNSIYVYRTAGTLPTNAILYSREVVNG